MNRISSCTGDDGCPTHADPAPSEIFERTRAELEHREAYATALEEVARQVRRNPEFPVPRRPSISICISAGSWDAELALVRAAARGMGVEAVRLDSHHIHAERKFGPLSVRVSAVSDEHMAGVYAAGSYVGSVTP
jgi:hypothetical protein